MIIKSYLIEKNINQLKQYKFILIYGPNDGLKKTLKNKIISNFKDTDILNLYQEDLNKNQDILINECKNDSLFLRNKTIIMNQSNDKLLSSIEYLKKTNHNNIIVLLSEILDKKSKLRSLFEKEKNFATIPCYEDSEITLKRIVSDDLKEFKNLNNESMNMILNYSGLNRNSVNSNLEKIKVYFRNKIIEKEKLETLLNSDRDETFDKIRDAALNGDKTYLNELINNFSFTKDQSYYYLNTINFRLNKMLEILNNKKNYISLEETINNIKPSIFWKDKPIFNKMINKWDKQRILEALKYLLETEIQMRKNTNLDQCTILKTAIINICSNSWNYFLTK